MRVMTKEECEYWNDNKEWWEPVFYVEGMEFFGSDDNTELMGMEANWLCDHMGDANDVLNKLWEKLNQPNKEGECNGRNL